MVESRLHRLLPRYLIGRLDEDDVADFKKHLASCEECQAEKAFLEEVQAQTRKHGDGLFEGHPPVERLVAYLGGELAEAEAAAIRRHLDLCATCAVEVRWISGEAVVTSSPEPSAAGRRGSPSWGFMAAAAAVVVAFLLPFLWIDGGLPPTTGLDPQLIAPIERAGSGETTVYLDAAQKRLIAFFPVDLPKSGFPCEVEVVGEDGRVVYEEHFATREALDQGLYVYFACGAEDCRQGAYTVRISSAGAEEPEIVPFRVVQR